MFEESKLEPSKELAYWIGVVQSDGHLKKSGISHYVVQLEVSSKSLLMLRRFEEISRHVLGKIIAIRQTQRGSWRYQVTISKFIDSFLDLDIKLTGLFLPPKWCVDKPVFFGAYLAGLIDGDGDIRIKRKEYPQCVIRVTSGHEQIVLKESIQKILGCGVTITKRSRISYLDGRKIDGTWFCLEFYVSSKTKQFIRKLVLPRLTLNHKIEKLLTYLER